MLIEKRLTLRYKHIAESESIAKKKRLEAVPNFRKKDIELAFVDIDQQSKQLAEQYGSISKVRAIITIQEIRNRLFEDIYNRGLYNGFDVRAFASHEPGEKTPLNFKEC